jgi:hypothetical protein
MNNAVFSIIVFVFFFSLVSSVDASNFEWIPEDEVFRFTGSDYSFDIELTVTYLGVERTLQEIRNIYPSITIGDYVSVGSSPYKFSIDFDNVPVGMPALINYFTYRIVSLDNINPDDIERIDDYTISVFDNKTLILFSDLIDNGYTLSSPDVFSVNVYGTAQQYIDGSIGLDPIILENETREIGYVFLNSTEDVVPPSEAETVYMWNTRDDYFFNKSSGMQFTNHFQDYWSKNVFCLGYYSGDAWNKIACVDELDNFNRNITTDNLTYVNATLWKDISYGSYDLRMGILYHLLINDTNLSVTVSGENIGTDIPFDIGFAWVVKNVSLPGLGEDYIEIDGTEYYLNEPRDESLTNLTNTIYHFHDLTKYMDLAWNENLNYRLNISGTNQDDFKAILMINAGSFSAGQKKQTTMTWIDADTEVAADPHPSLDQKNALWGPYWLNTTTGVIIYVLSPDDLRVSRTEDGGANWAESTIEVASGFAHRPSVWFDQETPGDTGTNLNLFWLDHTTNGADDTDAKFAVYDVATGTVGTVRTVDAGITTTGFHWEVRTGMTKTVSGNIIACLETQAEIECYKSNDLFAADNNAIADAFEATSSEDSMLIFPADTGDDNDAAALYWDESASEISIKMYDDSADTWNETSVSSGMDLTDQNVGWDAALRLSDKHVLLAAHSNDDSAADNLMTWNLTVDSIASPTVSATTNVFTGVNQAGQVGMVINQQTDTVYVGYLLGGAYFGTVDVTYHITAT